MAMIRSFTVGNGDMFYIKHDSDSFTIIDCQLFGEHKEWLVDELIQELEARASHASFPHTLMKTICRELSILTEGCLFKISML